MTLHEILCRIALLLAVWAVAEAIFTKQEGGNPLPWWGLALLLTGAMILTEALNQ